MNDASRQNDAKRATIAQGNLWRGLAQRVRHPVALTLAAVAAFVICGTHAAFAGADSIPASGIGYLCLSLAVFGCSMAFWIRSRTARGKLYVRWWLIAVGALSASIGYFPSFTEAALHAEPARGFQTACFNASEALYMLAAVLFFAGVTRSIVIVDLLQAMLFMVLRFNLIYSPVTRDHFRVIHLLVGQLVAVFLFLVAVVACLGAASRSELKFLRMLSGFFGIRVICLFLCNQVSYIWLHHIECSLWDVPSTVLLNCFALYMVFIDVPARAEGQASDALQPRSLMVRSLMPSFLALGNLMLGLFLLPISFPLAAVAISMSLICYVVRTALLQGQAVREKALLQSRNEQLEGLAIRDPLTGIGNRRSLAGVFGQLQASAGCDKASLLAIDIDCFKEANDRHGHLHGDSVLVALARKLEQLAAGIAGSHCARLGGDEFVILMPGVSSEKACALAEQLRALFKSHKFAANDAMATLSIGVASLNASTDLPLELLISYADRALYRAKRLGRDRVEAMPVWEAGTGLTDPSSLTLRLELQHTAR